MAITPDRQREIEEALMGMEDLKKEEASLIQEQTKRSERAAGAKAHAEEAQQLDRLFRGQFSDADREEAQRLGVDISQLYNKKFRGSYDMRTGAKIPGTSGASLGELNSDWVAANLITRNKESAERESGLAEIDRMLREKRLGMKEKETKAAIIGARYDTESAIDAELQGLLEEQGIGANVARQQMGASLAERGLSRSTTAQRGIGDIYAQEFQGKAQARMGAFQTKQAVRQQERNLYQAQARAKEQLDTQKATQFEMQLLDQVQMGEKAMLEAHMRSIAEQKALGQKGQAFTSNLIGGLFQAGTMALAYSALGPAGGVAAGAVMGGMK